MQATVRISHGTLSSKNVSRSCWHLSYIFHDGLIVHSWHKKWRKKYLISPYELAKFCGYTFDNLWQRVLHYCVHSVICMCRFNGLTKEELMQRSLPDRIKAGLDILIVSWFVVTIVVDTLSVPRPLNCSSSCACSFESM